MSKNRKQKESEYKDKYSDIPRDYYERLRYMTELYNLNDSKMNEIVHKRNLMLDSLMYYDLNIILYEEPEGTPRPRFRIVNRKNVFNQAISNSNFVHVYSINAKDDQLYMQRLTSESLLNMNGLINTPCNIVFNAYFKTPSSFSITDTFLAEIGIIDPITKPDFDNIAKKYSDMYNHNIWIDDSFVKSGTVNKFYSILPRVEIQLRYLNCVYNKYQYNMITKRRDYDGRGLSYFDSKGGIIHGE